MTARRHYRVPRALAGLAVALLVVALAGWGWHETRQRHETPDTAAGSGAGSIPVASDARTALAQLSLVERHPVTAPYDRDAFGSPWSDVDGNGCNQRDDVLLRDAEPGSTRVQQQGGCDHDVLGGTWLDPYTGRTLVLDDLKDSAQAQAVQIDHVVPLAEAWASGASRWSDERRRRYANDLDDLLAVDGPTNAGKGSDDPAAWRPRAAYQCAYATRWVEVKAQWALGADTSEVAALGEMLDRCGTAGTSGPPHGGVTWNTPTRPVTSRRNPR